VHVFTAAVDDYTPPTVQMVSTPGGAHPEPPLDLAWPKLKQLQWLAALVEIRTGLRVRAGQAKYKIGGIPQRGYFSVSVSHRGGGGSSGPYRFDSAWAYLNGIETGAEAMRLTTRKLLDEQPHTCAMDVVLDGEEPW